MRQGGCPTAGVEKPSCRDVLIYAFGQTDFATLVGLGRLRAFAGCVRRGEDIICTGDGFDCAALGLGRINDKGHRLVPFGLLERAMRFELTTLTLARLCSTPELRPHSVSGVLAKAVAGCKGAIRAFPTRGAKAGKIRWGQDLAPVEFQPARVVARRSHAPRTTP